MKCIKNTVLTLSVLAGLGISKMQTLAGSTITRSQQFELKQNLAQNPQDTIPAYQLDQFDNVYQSLLYNSQIRWKSSMVSYRQQEDDPNKIVVKTQSTILAIPRGNMLQLIMVQVFIFKNGQKTVIFSSNLDSNTLIQVPLTSYGLINGSTLNFIQTNANAFTYNADETKNQCNLPDPLCVPVNTLPAQ